ncbi:hypothetical protein D3C77_401890 [compost metagenome]
MLNCAETLRALDHSRIVHRGLRKGFVVLLLGDLSFPQSKLKLIVFFGQCPDCLCGRVELTIEPGESAFCLRNAAIVFARSTRRTSFCLALLGC